MQHGDGVVYSTSPVPSARRWATPRAAGCPAPPRLSGGVHLLTRCLRPLAGDWLLPARETGGSSDLPTPAPAAPAGQRIQRSRALPGGDAPWWWPRAAACVSGIPNSDCTAPRVFRPSRAGRMEPLESHLLGLMVFAW